MIYIQLQKHKRDEKKGDKRKVQEVEGIRTKREKIRAR
jgi:hypothetical protein